jgi:putative transposase
MDAGFCIDCLEEAFEVDGEPEIVNRDQGSPLTNPKFQDRFADRSARISNGWPRPLAGQRLYRAVLADGEG